ncbi:unnamed protein product [Notodromas monacha]|uniref:Hemerythrin-like domain-containing protein n=1 Tax=Notodromas monacha TaxID=399045 RepID=A0A7R9BNA6_9CRUS|nr:unnamed protein product [Notodromas monacha]CAG0918660.1 unnamed protein product [Notodromas monacha]
MPPLSAEVDVFRVPHYRMKSLVNRSLRRYAEADFTDNLVPNSLLVHLRRLLEDIRTHESIEESLIMKQLVERVGGLPGPRPDCWAKLNDHTCVMPKIVDLVAEITLALASTSRKVDAKAVVGATYYLVHSVYLEHIVEEEGLIMSLLLDYFNPEELVQLKRVVVNEHARSMIGFSTACCEYGSGCVGNEISFDLDMRSAGGLPFESCEEAWACLEAAVGDLRPEDLKPKITVISCQVS